MAPFERHLFICTNQREPGSARGCCSPDGKGELQKLFKEAVGAAGLAATVRANKAGCLDQCEHGPTVVVYTAFTNIAPSRQPREAAFLGGKAASSSVSATTPFVKADCPEAVWYGFVQAEDVAEIVREHIAGGRPVERLRLPESCVNTASCAHKPRDKPRAQ